MISQQTKSMATSFNRLVASAVFFVPVTIELQMGFSVPVKLLRVTERPSFLSRQKFVLSDIFAFWWVESVD